MGKYLIHHDSSDLTITVKVRVERVTNREWETEQRLFLSHFLAAAYYLPASVSRLAEDLERLTGEITGHCCQPQQISTMFSPNIQYATQIITEEWEEEGEEEELCACQNPFMLREWLIKEIKVLWKMKWMKVRVWRDKAGMRGIVWVLGCRL